MGETRELQWVRKGDTRSVLLFVHGFTGSHETWGKFIETITSATNQASPFKGWSIATFGYPSTLLGGWIPFWRGDPSIPRLAVLLQTACATGDLANMSLALVAHSMGGLIVQRALLDSDELRHRTGLFYMYGTPSLGAELSSYVFTMQRQIPEMRPGNEFLVRLRTDWKNKFGDDPPFTFLTLAGSQDQFVKPESSLDPFHAKFRAIVRGDHLSMIRCGSSDDPAVAKLADGLAKVPFRLGPIETAMVAAELSDFREVIRLLAPRADRLDDAAKVRLALALEMTGKRDEAIALLGGAGKGATDLLGSLAGQLKRRWTLYREEADAKRALELYAEGFARSRTGQDHNQAHYHGINLAFMQLVYEGKRADARATAESVIEHCKLADDVWRHASLAEANLILGHDAAALEAYGQARQDLKSARDLLSAYNQAILILKALNKEDQLPALERAFQVASP